MSDFQALAKSALPQSEAGLKTESVPFEQAILLAKAQVTDCQRVQEAGIMNQESLAMTEFTLDQLPRLQKSLDRIYRRERLTADGNTELADLYTTQQAARDAFNKAEEEELEEARTRTAARPEAAALRKASQQLEEYEDLLDRPVCTNELH